MPVERGSAAHSRAQALDVLPLAGDCCAETIEALRRAAIIRTFVRGDVIIREGEDMRVLLILAGFVLMRRTDAQGRRFSPVILREGQTIGVRSVSRSASAFSDFVALTPGRAAIFRGDVLRGIAAGDPGFGLRLLDILAEMVSLLNHRIEELESREARPRLATILLAYEPLFAESNPIVSRSDLASLVGTSREMLGSVMRDFEASGVIRRTGRGIRILDPRALRECADWNGGGREHARWLRIATAGPPRAGRSMASSRSANASAPGG